MAFDLEGNLYIAESSGNRIRKITTNGFINTIAGTGISGYNGDSIEANTAMLNSPSGVAVDNSGNIYIADCGNYRIRRINVNTGIINTIAGIGISGYSGDGGLAKDARISIPYDLCVDSDNNIYFTDYGNFRIRKIDNNGFISTYAGNGTMGSSGDFGPATLAQFINIYGIQINHNGDLYVADWNAGKIRKIGTNGIISTIVGTGILEYNGDFILATSANVSPIRFVVNELSEIYIADYNNKRIRKVNKNGYIETVGGVGIGGFTGDGFLAIEAKVEGTNGVALDSCGNLYVSSHFSRIRKIEFNPYCWPTNVKNVENRDDFDFTLYPNPVTDEITVRGNKLKSIVIYNAVGQVVYEKEFNKTEMAPVNVSKLPLGVYVVRVNDVWVGKVVKE